MANQWQGYIMEILEDLIEERKRNELARKEIAQLEERNRQLQTQLMESEKDLENSDAALTRILEERKAERSFGSITAARHYPEDCKTCGVRLIGREIGKTYCMGCLKEWHVNNGTWRNHVSHMTREELERQRQNNGQQQEFHLSRRKRNS